MPEKNGSANKNPADYQNIDDAVEIPMSTDSEKPPVSSQPTAADETTHLAPFTAEGGSHRSAESNSPSRPWPITIWNICLGISCIGGSVGFIAGGIYVLQLCGDACISDVPGYIPLL
jgi:hypothetical protein